MNNIDNPELLTEAFKIFDSDGSGQITRAELKVTLNDIMSGTGEMLSEEEITEMINEFDRDGDGMRPPPERLPEQAAAILTDRHRIAC